MLEIHPQYLKLSDLLKGRLFRIPEYQRAYSWKSKQRKDLFEDIVKIAGKPDEVHFMATIVGLRRDTLTIVTDEFQRVEVVDGQQRLTTLIMLLKAIEERANTQDAVENQIREELRGLLVKTDDLSLILLQTNHDLSHYFSDFLRQGIVATANQATNLSDKALLQGIAECREFVDKWISRGSSLVELLKLLKNRLTFIFHELGDERIVYTVFETLNSRGLDVSWFDRLKSILMGTVFETGAGNQEELIDEVHNLWGDIYRCIGLHQGLSTEALRFAATLKLDDRPSRALGEEDSVETLRMLSPDGPQVIRTTKWIKQVTEAVDLLWADRRKNAVRKIAHARLVVTAVNLRSDLDPTCKEKVLKLWENVTFRIFGMYRRDARTGVGDYVRLAWHIAKDNIACDRIISELTSLGANYPIAAAVDQLRNTDCYNEWQEELRYLLFRYEESLAQKANQIFDNQQWNRIWEASPSQSIEHISPQSKCDENNVHRVGNLVLLPPGLNSSLGAKDPADKGHAYQQTGLLIAQKVVPALSAWDAEAIDARENEILQWACTEWA